MDRPADRWNIRWRTAQLHQPIVTPATGHRTALAKVGNRNLEHKARVVFQRAPELRRKLRPGDIDTQVRQLLQALVITLKRGRNVDTGITHEVFHPCPGSTSWRIDADVAFNKVGGRHRQPLRPLVGRDTGQIP